MSENHIIAYVIPTKDRPDDLRVLLASILKQTVIPHQIIVVDGSAPDIKAVCDAFSALAITYVRCYPPSLAKQRNAGMAALRADVTIAGYLDDDLELDATATERMLAFWNESTPETGGAAMSIRNQPDIQSKALLRLFGMTGDIPGSMLQSGFPVPIPFVESTIQTDWLYGGATIWRRSVIEIYPFDQWYIGHGFMEDIDYSYRVSRDYKLYVVGDSRCMHYSRPLSDERQYEFARQQIYNRVYFVRKMKSFSRPRVCWALFGTFVINLLAFFRHRNRARFDRIRGNLAAFKLLLAGDTSPIAGFWK